MPIDQFSYYFLVSLNSQYETYNQNYDFSSMFPGNENSLILHLSRLY
jgi:hypothetical protein